MSAVNGTPLTYDTTTVAAMLGLTRGQVVHLVHSGVLKPVKTSTDKRRVSFRFLLSEVEATREQLARQLRERELGQRTMIITKPKARTHAREAARSRAQRIEQQLVAIDGRLQRIEGALDALVKAFS